MKQPPLPPRRTSTATTAASAQFSPSPGLVVAGKYRLMRALREGAMGSVWVATHLALDTHVAIKFLSLSAEHRETGSRPATPAATLLAEAKARFEREAKAAAAIRSANIVQVLDFGIQRDIPYIVMELLDGEDLETRLRRVQRLPMPEVARLLVPLARALHRAHESGLVHRDLKPANIFLAKEGEDEVPKILDFGVAKALHGDRKDTRDLTVDGVVVGTPAYMSPEQAIGSTELDHRSDLWSLGVVLFRAVTGEKPFHAQGMLETIVEICSKPIPRASDALPGLSEQVDQFFAQALERDVGKRFQSAKELARAFLAFAPRPASLPPEAPDTDDGSIDPQSARFPQALDPGGRASWSDSHGAPSTGRSGVRDVTVGGGGGREGVASLAASGTAIGASNPGVGVGESAIGSGRAATSASIQPLARKTARTAFWVLLATAATLAAFGLGMVLRKPAPAALEESAAARGALTDKSSFPVKPSTAAEPPSAASNPAADAPASSPTPGGALTASPAAPADGGSTTRGGSAARALTTNQRERAEPSQPAGDQEPPKGKRKRELGY